MPVDVLMPQMGESIFEGTITKWLKKPGDKVERDEPLFEISTDKVDAEIPAPSAGVLKEIKVAEGQTVPIQTVVAVIDAAGAAAATAPAAAPARTEAPQAAAPPPRPSLCARARRRSRGPAGRSRRCTGRARHSGACDARECRAARAHLLWALRSAAHDRDAAAHRRAHGGFQARLAPRVLRG